MLHIFFPQYQRKHNVLGTVRLEPELQKGKIILFVGGGKLRKITFALALLMLFAIPVFASSVGYTFDVTTFYQFGCPSGTVFNVTCGSPDTGFFTITNNGSSTFTGTVGDVAVSQFAGDFSFSTLPLTITPGGSVTIGTSPESSNVGGFNGPFGTTQPGIEIFLNGTVALGLNSEAVNLSVNDSNIHSGVPATNPFGVTLDNYVLRR